MPELPEVESARATIDAAALHRSIVDVDDSDTFECRPHAPGDIKVALLGRSLTAVHRRGKSIWCDTSRAGRSRTPGPTLGLHLGMSGRILVTDAHGTHFEGGDGLSGRYWGDEDDLERKPAWFRFTLTFADGGTLRLFDKRRLGRVRLDPDLSRLGPDAEQVDVDDFADRVGRGRSPVKARLLDQSVVAGVGNLLADETLWEAGISPARPSDELDEAELRRLHEALQHATKDAIARGGVHTGEMIPFRRAGAHCPRCGTEMTRATVGGRTTWWCTHDQT